MDLFSGHTVAACCAAFVLWRVLRFVICRGHLSHIPGPRRVSWFRGNFNRFFNIDGWKFHEELYREYGGVARVDMMLGDQHLYVTDPLAMHHIIVKDQCIFEEGDKFLVTNKLAFGPGLLSSLGDEHKRQRKLLTPFFSLKHMRNLVPMFYPIAYKLCSVLEREVTKGQESFDVMTWISRAALEYLGQGGLGYSFDALDVHCTNAYSDAMKSFNPMLDKLNFFRQFLPHAVKVGSPTLRRKLVEMIPSQSVKTLVSIIDEVEKNSKNILRGKREALKHGDEEIYRQIDHGKDILSVLMKAHSSGGQSNLPEEELLAHMSTFLVAGHDTTTGATCRVLHVLSQRPEAQERLRAEVTAARREHGDLDYDELMALPYLDAVCRETLRMYPPVPLVERITRKDAVLPLLWPVTSTDGKEIKEIFIKKDTTVYVSILGANRSKEIWGEDADEWKPERWLKSHPQRTTDVHFPGVYGQTMTFLGGGRACIGFKFSETELKLVLSVLLEKFVFEPGPEVIWVMGGLQQPVVKGSDMKTVQVPLKVSLVSN